MRNNVKILKTPRSMENFCMLQIWFSMHSGIYKYISGIHDLAQLICASVFLLLSIACCVNNKI